MKQRDADEAINELEELVRQGVLEDDTSQGLGTWEDAVYPIVNSGNRWALGVTENPDTNADSPYFFTVYELDDRGEVEGLWGEHFDTVSAINEARENMNKQQAAAPQPVQTPAPANPDRLYDLHGKGGNMTPEEAVEYKDHLQRYKEQNGHHPGFIGAWVNQHCKFAFDQGPLVGDPRTPRPERKPLPKPQNHFPSPMTSTQDNIKTLIRQFEQTGDPAIRKQLASMGVVRNSSGVWSTNKA